MVSKNNRRKKMEAAAERKPHFAIRKLTIGAASVLLGTSLWMSTSISTVHADEATNNGDGSPDTDQESAKAASTGQVNKVVVEQGQSSNESTNQSTENSNSVSEQQTQNQSQNTQESANESNGVSSENAQQDKATTSEEQNSGAAVNANNDQTTQKDQSATTENKANEAATQTDKANEQKAANEQKTQKAETNKKSQEVKKAETNNSAAAKQAQNSSEQAAINSNNSTTENKANSVASNANINNSDIANTQTDLTQSNNVQLNKSLPSSALEDAGQAGKTTVKSNKDNSQDLKIGDLSSGLTENELKADLGKRTELSLDHAGLSGRVEAGKNADPTKQLAALKASLVQLDATSADNYKTVSDFSGIQDAVNSGAAGVNISGSITADGNLTLNNNQKFVINGVKGASLNFGTNTINLNTGNELTLANITIDSDNAGGAVVSNDDNNVINFKNVTNNKNSLFNGKGQVHIQGKVTTNVNDNSQVGNAELQGFGDAANTVSGGFLSDTFNKGGNNWTKPQTVSDTNWAIIQNIDNRKVPNIYASNLYIDDNAVLNVNRTATGDGIVLRDGAETHFTNANIVSSKSNSGKLNVGKNAVLNINLKDSQLSGSQLKSSEFNGGSKTDKRGIDNLNAGVRVNTSGSFTSDSGAVINMRVGHGRGIVFSENNVTTSADQNNTGVYNDNYIFKGQEGGVYGGYTLSDKGTSYFTDYVKANPGLKNTFKLGNNTSFTLMGREAFMLGSNASFESGENSKIIVHNYGHGNGLDMGSADGAHDDSDPDHSGQMIIGQGSDVEFYSDGKNTTTAGANFGMNTYFALGGGGKIRVLKDATLRVILTGRGASTYNDNIQINSRDPELSPEVYVGNNATLDVQSDATQGNAELIAIPLSASKDINFILDNVKYVNLQKTAKTGATTLAPGDPNLVQAAGKAHVPASSAGYGNLIIMNTGRDGKGHLQAFGNLAAFKWSNENLSSNGLNFDPNETVSQNYSKFENSANQTWSNMYGFDMPYTEFSTTRESGEVWVDPNGSTAGTNVNSNNGAAFTDFVKGFSPYMSQRLVVIGHSLQPVENQRTVHYVVQDVDENGNPIETDPSQMREIADPYVQSAQGDNAQSQLLYKDNATDQLVQIERNADGTPKLDEHGAVIPVRDADGNYQIDGDNVNWKQGKGTIVRGADGHYYFQGYTVPGTITGTDGNGNQVISLDGGLYTLATDSELNSITTNTDEVVKGGKVNDSIGFANNTNEFRSGNFYNTYKDGNLYVVYRAVAEKAQVKIVDDDNNGAVLKTENDGGNYRGNINFSNLTTDVNDYIQQGYKVVRANSDDGKTTDANLAGTDPTKWTFGTFDNDPQSDQSFTVHLIHDVVPVTPDTPGTDIPKKPDGSQAVDPNTLKKTVNLTVTYRNADGTPFTGAIPNNANQSLEFDGTVYIDRTNGQEVNAKQDNNGNWIIDKDSTADPTQPTSWVLKGTRSDNGSFTAVNSPEETGYPIIESVRGEDNTDYNDGNGNVKSITNINHSSSNIRVEVVYGKNPTPTEENGKISVIFHDTTTNQDIPNHGFGTPTDPKTGKTGDPTGYTPTDDITDLENKGYVPDGTVPTVPTTFPDPDKPINIVINMKHGTIPVTPDNPKTPTDPINDPQKDPDGPKYPNGVGENDLNKTVQRKINYVGVNADGSITPVNGSTDPRYTTSIPQSVKFTRTAIVDKVTGQILGYDTNGDGQVDVTDGNTAWTPASQTLPSETSKDPSQVLDKDGKAFDQVSQTVVESATVDHTSSDLPDVTVVYTHKTPGTPEVNIVTGKQTVHYVDGDNNNAKLMDDSVNDTITFINNNGTWNETSYKYADANAPVINGYVTSQKTYEGQTATPSDPNKEITIVYHKIGKIVPVDPNHNPIPDAPTPDYHNDPTDPTKVVPDEPVPTIPGKTPDQPSVTPTDPTKDTPVIYRDNAKDVTTVVHYLDQDENNALILSSPNFTGKEGTQIGYSSATDLKSLTDRGYVLVNNGYDPNNVAPNFDSKVPVYNIVLKHGVDHVTPDNPGHGYTKSDLQKTVTRDFQYIFNDGSNHPEVKEDPQSVTFNGQGYFDKVTGQLVTVDQDGNITGPGQITWDKATDTLAAVGAKTVNGYQVVSTMNANGDGSASELTVNPNTASPIHVIVHYAPTTPDAETVVGHQTVHYVDGDNNNAKLMDDSINSTFTFTKSGETGQWNENSHKYADANAPVINGYVTSQKTYEGQTGTPSDPNKEITIVYHKIGKIVPVDPDHNPIPDAPTPDYHNDPTDPTKVVPDESVPTIPGKTPDQPSVTPTDPTKDTPVIYRDNAKDVTTVVHYLDQDENNALILSSPNFTGKEGTQIGYSSATDLKSLTDRGYVLVNNGYDPNGTAPNFDSKVPVYNIVLKHGVDHVTPDNPGHGYTRSDLQKTVTRDFQYIFDDGSNHPEVKEDPQSVTFNGQGYFDKVTGQMVTVDGQGNITGPGQITWDKATDTLAAVGVKTVNGFHVVSTENANGDGSVSELTVNPNTASPIHVIVHYAPNTTPTPNDETVVGHQTVHYVDGDNNNAKLMDDSINSTFTFTKNGATGQWNENSHKYADANAPVINGYVTSQKTYEGQTGTPSDPNKEITIVYHKIGKIVPVDPDHNPIPDAPTPDYHNDPTDPTKVVPDEPVPTIPGKTPDQPSVTPTDPTKDTPVIYRDNAKDVNGSVKYIDDTTNSTLSTDNFSGKVGDSIDYTTAGKISNYEGQGYELVSNNFNDGNERFASEGNNFEVHFKHTYSPVTPDNPHGVDKNELTQDVKFTIHYVYTDGSTAHDDNVQTATWTKHETIDNVTGNIVPNGQYTTGWTSDKSSYDAVPSPTIKDYTPNQLIVGGRPVTRDNQEVTVIYSKNPETPVKTTADGKITYIDDTANSTLSTDTVNGYVGDQINYTTADKIKSYEDAGYKLVSNNFRDGQEVFANNGNNFEVHFVHNFIPVNPDHPHDGVDPSTYTKNVKETVHYVGAGDKTPADNVQNSVWTKTVTVDQVTGKVVDGGQYDTDWSIKPGEKTVYDQVNTPVVDGYHADKRDVPATAVTQDDITQVVTYTPNGKIIPVDPNGNPIPNVPTPTYPTDPTDPTKVTPDEPVPNVPNMTPRTPTVTPTDPGKDTPVPYDPVTPAKDQVAQIIYRDVNDPSNITQIGTSGDITGASGSQINYDPSTQIQNFEDKGYVLRNNGFPAGAVFDNDDSRNQIFYIDFVHGTVPVTPDKPGKPGEPINPNDPDGPKWPEGTDEDSIKKTGTQTIHYVGAGDKTPADNKQEYTFTKNMVVDKVTGQVLDPGSWSETSHTFGTVETPVIDGYHADKRNAGGTTVTINDLNKTVTVTYTPNGKIVPVDPNGNPIPNVPTPQYPTDPTDPTKVTPDEPVPNVPGMTPSTPTVTPTDPGKDTPVPYNPVTPAKDQNAVVNYVDADNNNSQIATSGPLTGKAGDKINYSTATTITDLENKGYVLVNDGFPKDATFDDDDNTTQTYTVVFKHGTTPVTPTNPGKPGEPINPNNPDGPKWPDGTGKNSIDKTVTRTITFVDGNGKEVSKPIEQTVHFTATGVIDNVTGKWVTPLTWSPDQSVDSENVPFVDGYHVVSIDRDGNGLTNVKGVTLHHGDDSYKVTVTYDQNGKIIPVGPDGKTPIPDAPTPTYPTDPKDPSKVTPNEPVPNVPGYTPSTPSVTPTDPGKDTPVIYNPVVKDGSVQVIFHDDTTNSTISGVGYNSGSQKAGTKVDYTTAKDISDLENKGYEYVSTDGTIPSEITGDQNVTVTVHMKHGTVPVTPDKPGKPGEPINPDNPDGPKWPEGTDENSIKKTGTQTIHYTGAGDKTPADNTQSFTFTKNMVVDKVTGQIIDTGTWNVTSHTFGSVDTPVVDGYHADKRTAGGTTITPDDLNKTVTVNYTGNGKIIPVDPSGKPIPNAPTPTYPTDPKDPTKVVPDEPVPSIPGYTPSEKTVTPKDPGKDTPVVYNPSTTPVTPDQPDNPNPTPDVPTPTPTPQPKPENNPTPNNTPETPAPAPHAEEPEVPSEPSTPAPKPHAEKPEVQNTPAPKPHAENGTPAKGNNNNGPVKGGNVVPTSAPVTKEGQAPQGEGQLPQTGEKDNTAATILGATAGMIGLIGLSGVKKKKHGKEDKD